MSRRWRYLWTAVPSVDMQLISGEKFKKCEFKEFVYWVLASKTIDLDSFRLRLSDCDSIATVWRWVHLAVTRHVKQIDLSFSTIKNTEFIELPHYLVSCGSLEVLKLDLQNHVLGLPRSVGFPALRVLDLTYVDLPGDDLVNDFLKSCPLLEDLSLVGCLLGELVCISFPKLKRLRIINWDDVVCHSIEISCPKLVDFDLEGCILKGYSKPVQFLGNSHFKWAPFYFFWESIDAACDLPLPNLKTLVLRTTMKAFTVDELILILKCCPKLENLTLIITKDFDEEYEWVDEAEARRIWPHDVERVEFFELNGEKPKLDIEWCDYELQMNCTFLWEKRSRASISERPKASKREDGVDLISNMPDAILLLILSRLSSTEEHIRTSILSRRWRSLWTAVPSVDMQFLSGEESKQSEFKEFMYWVLASKTVNLDSFHLSLYNCDSIETVWRWVCLAVMRNVKQIDFSFWIMKDTKTIELPHYLVSCSSLEVLKLDLKNHGLSLPRFVGFPALRVLHLTYVDLPEDNDLVNRFLKSCPFLEDLSLIGCLLGKLVCISYPNLKKLRIINWDDYVGCHGIKISCPKLVDLDLGGCIWEGDSDPVLFHGNYLFKWAHFYFFWESIDAACDVALPNLKNLVLRTTMEAFTVDELTRILKCCPKLENLTLIIAKKSERQKASKWEDGVDLISNMPDAILVLILSRLSSTEEQIRSSILSRRWRSLWTAVPTVDMKFLSGEESKQIQFKEFMYWVLASKTVNLDSFRLRLYKCDSIETVWRWIRLAVTRNVKQIDFFFWTMKDTKTIELPRYLVSCSSLEVLRLDFRNHGLSLPMFVGFPALRVLHLTYVDLPEDDDLVNDFLKRLPLLEDLSLIGCLLGELVCISFPNLKKLRIINWDDYMGCHGIKISCPKLVDLDLGGSIWEGDSDPVLFNGNYHFKWAHLYFFWESIDAACDLPLPNLKTLVLRTTMEAFTVDELTRILKYCPKLENLKLIITKYFDEEYEWVDEAETRRIWTRDVKRVEFFEFNGERPKLDIEWCENELQMNFTFFWEKRSRASVIIKEKSSETPQS
ncbi:hypothetical protein LXL04_003226 [Taraxacum kok-saghyz]